MQTHNHQSTHLVLLIRHSKQSLRENHGEDIRVTISHQGDGYIKHCLALAYPHTDHTQCHHYNADHEESTGLHHTKESCTSETSDGTEDEVERCGESCIIQTPAQTLHQNLRSCGIGTHIDAYMTHDTDEGKQHDRFAKQLETLTKARSLAFILFFLNRSTCQEECGCYSDNHIDWEKNSPTQTEGWNACHSTPHSDVWCKERSDGLDKLTKGQSGSQILTRCHYRNQRIQGGLHQGISYTQQRE